MERLVKPEILTSYIYGPTFGNAESHLFLFLSEYNTESKLTHVGSTALLSGLPFPNDHNILIHTKIIMPQFCSYTVITLQHSPTISVIHPRLPFREVSVFLTGR
jgi:hypothetical protein